MVGEMTGRNVSRLQRLGWGRMWVARSRRIYTYKGEPWGFDNGAYRDWVHGRPFDEGAYADRLARALAHPCPYLAVLPDLVAGGLASLHRSAAWLPRVTPSWPWYLAVQDGVQPDDARSFAPFIAGVFLGGSNAYKATAQAWRAWTLEHGLRFHFGRAGTPSKVAFALECAADSLDSAFPLWTMRRWRAFERLVQHGPQQLRLQWDA